MTVVSEKHVNAVVGSATLRSPVTVLGFPDGFIIAADLLTFDGLADGKEHLLLAPERQNRTPMVFSDIVLW